MFDNLDFIPAWLWSVSYKGFKNLFYIEFDNDHKLTKVEDEQLRRAGCHSSWSEGMYTHIFMVKVGLV